MNFITKTLNKLFKSSNQLELNKIKPIVVKINDLEKNFSNFKTENFVEKTQEKLQWKVCFENQVLAYNLLELK